MYIELHARSAFSFLEGASVPERLVEVCRSLGMPALALLDRDGVYGSPRCHLAATKAKMKAHIGAEVTCSSSLPCHPERSRTRSEANRPAERKDPHPPQTRNPG